MAQGAAATTTLRHTLKPLLSRKTWLLDSYTATMQQNDMFLFAHYNNLLQEEDKSLRDTFRKLDGKIVYLKTHLFKIWCRNQSHGGDICQPKINQGQTTEEVDHPLMPLLIGPTAMVTFPAADPATLSKALRQFKKVNNRLILLGGLVESQVMNVGQLTTYSKLPGKPPLQAQLVSLLQRNSTDLVNLLTHHSSHLVHILTQRKDTD